MRTCSICVRGGSKGIPNKNIRLIAGIPLLVHSLKQAFETKIFDAVAVSSDSAEILEIARSIPNVLIVQRPNEMATDHSAKVPAIRHCLVEIEKHFNQKATTVVDLDATSPLRNTQDIINCIELLENSPDCSNVVTGTPARRSPYFNLLEENNGYVQLSKTTNPPIIRRQDSPKCYDMNASIYVWRREVLINENKVILPKTKIYEMPEERSIDIDSPLDFKIVEMLINERVH